METQNDTGEERGDLWLEARWKPWCYHPAYLIFLVALQMVSIAVLEIVLRQYKATVAESSHDGMFGFDTDDGASFTAWTVPAMAFAIINGLLWEIVHASVCRLEPLYQLARLDGAPVDASLTLDYTGTNTFWVPIKAARHNHWTVLIASGIYILAFSVVPTLTSSLWQLDWGRSSIDVMVDTSFIRGLQAVNAVIAALAVALGIVLFRRRSGLLKDISSATDLAGLVVDNPGVLQLLRQIPSYERSEVIKASLSHLRFRFGYVRREDGVISAELVATPADSDSQTDGTSTILPTRDASRYEASHLDAHPLSLWARSIWAVQAVLVILTVTSILGLQFWDFSLFFTELFFTAAFTISASTWQGMQCSMAMIEPFFSALAPTTPSKQPPAVSNPNPPQRFHVLHKRYTSGSTLLILSQAISNGDTGVFMVAAFGTMLTNVLILINGPLWSAYYAIIHGTFYFMPAAVSGIEIAQNIIYYPGAILSFATFVTILRSRRTRIFAPRQPDTLLSRILYLCNSHGLLEDVRAERNTLTARADRKYLFGWFQSSNNQWYVGLERAEELSANYKFGETAPGVMRGVR
jgi:hypothetical protein